MNPVFVVRLSAIGDTIIAARAAQTLCEHGCNVVFVTHASQRDVMAAIPSLQTFLLIDENQKLIAYQKRDGTFSQVPLHDFKFKGICDAIDLQGTSRSRRALELVKKNFSIGLRAQRVGKRTLFRNALVFASWLMAYRQLRNKPLDPKKIVRVSVLQERAVQRYLRTKKIAYRGPTECYLSVGARSLANQKPYVLVFVGASFALKAWPKEHVREFIRGVLASTQFDVVLCGGKADAAVADYLAFDDAARIKNLAAKTSLAEVMTLARDASFILSNDSFGAHLADAFKKKGAVVFGATSPLFGFAPREPSISIHYANLDCSPCARHGQGTCRFQNLKCLRVISPNEVLAKIFES